MLEAGKHLFARKPQLEILHKCRERLRKGQGGSVVWVPAEAGYGKTALLSFFEKETTEGYSAITAVYAQTQAPIGTTRIGSLQPLYPFTRVVEHLAKKEAVSPEKKLAFNIGMSVLGLIPIVGDFPFLVKELRRDFQEFKHEKKSGKSYSTAATELYEVLKSYAEKSPLILLFDDMHYSDAQSVEVLSLFFSDIIKLPVMIVVAYRPAAAKDVISPLLPLIEEWKPDGNAIHKLQLLEFTNTDITKCCQSILPHYKKHEEFEQWLWAKSSGIPGLLFEYLHYFHKNTPFDSLGALIPEFHNENIIPTTLHSTFARLVEQLDDDDRTLLALCSAEGRECTVHIVSKLLNTDTLTTIKKMRSVQRKTGIITSIGAQNRYGIKTTVYQFTQAFYQQFFHNTLEYEEKITLHRQISDLLRTQYSDTADETVRRALAPYIMAHDIEGDTDAETQQFINETQALAKSSGNSEILNELNSLNISINSVNGEENNESEKIEESVFTVAELQKQVVAMFLSENFGAATELCASWIHNNMNAHASDRAVCLALQARCLIELGEINHARQLCEQGISLLNTMPNPIAECLLQNTIAVALMREGSDENAEYYLLKAAKPSPLLSPEYRLMTITNISYYLEKRSPSKAQKLKKAAMELAASLHFNTFLKEHF